ncbi:MAG: phenylalanine--tRNA ligase subunit alpha [Candidatus Berkelbacteria bacterium]
MKHGTLHPTSIFIREAVSVFEELGFDVFEGPEVETEWYNFDALNVPADHPSRDVQDTFWLKDGRALRPHTSNCQVRYGETHEPPFRVIVPGRCFRNESTDARHETTFYQLEGLYVDRDVKVGHLMWTLSTFLEKLYGKEIKYRFRPHHYPFVEPGFDVDIMFGGKWMEILGSGMVHPSVLENMNIDSEKFTGFAFGLGIDRLVMLKYGITDIRQLYSNDLRFIKQF